jgi:lipopolysaccharide export system protein LptA
MLPNIKPIISNARDTALTRQTKLIIAVVLLTLGVSTLQAAQDDPITIEADRATLSEKQGVSTYTGNVVLTQGGIKINADEVIVHHDAGKLTHVTALGSPVQYYQQGESPEKDIHGEAKTMEYFADEQRLLLVDSAKLTQGGNAFSGNRIEYDTQREVVTAAVAETGKERVQVTIQPNTLTVPEPNQQAPADSPKQAPKQAPKQSPKQ